MFNTDHTFIIAEAGCNHECDIDIAKLMIDSAHSVGADAIKFQTYKAEKLASKSPLLMKLGHDAMYRQQDMALDDALEFLRSQLSLTLSTEDVVEGVSAFFEKREPQWKGR